MVAQASKYGSSLEICFKASMRRTYPIFLWSIASVVGIIGTKYATRPSGAGHKVCSQDNWHEQSKGENEVK